MLLNYANYAFGVDNLGPEIRNVLWFQGCCFECDGCVAPSHRGDGGKWMETKELAIILTGGICEGITISGGEPFLQVDALYELLTYIKNESDKGVIVYTGFMYEKLIEMSIKNEKIKAILDLIDFLIDGPYIKERDRGEFLRGSDNQRFINLTHRYDDEEIDKINKQARKMVIKTDNNMISMIGIPSEDELTYWNKLKKYLGII